MRAIQTDYCAITGCLNLRRKAGNGRSRFCSAHHAARHRSGIAKIAPLRAPAGSGYVNEGGYRQVYDPTHPLALPNGSVLEHRRVLYEAMGEKDGICFWCFRPLFWDRAVQHNDHLAVDHLDGDRLNNVPLNLVPACPSCNSKRMHLGNPLDFWVDPYPLSQNTPTPTPSHG